MNAEIDDHLDASVTVEMRSGETSRHIKLEQMPLDLANGHAARVHRHDLLVEARKPGADSGQSARIERPQSGTTLTEQILSSHPAVAASGKLGFWTNRVAPWRAIRNSGQADREIDLG